MTNTKPARDKDFGAVSTLVALALIGLIPWVCTLFGSPPAFSADLGAVITLGAVFLLVPTLWEMRQAARHDRSEHHDERD